ATPSAEAAGASARRARRRSAASPRSTAPVHTSAAGSPPATRASTGHTVPPLTAATLRPASPRRRRTAGRTSSGSSPARKSATWRASASRLFVRARRSHTMARSWKRVTGPEDGPVRPPSSHCAAGRQSARLQSPRPFACPPITRHANAGRCALTCTHTGPGGMSGIWRSTQQRSAVFLRADAGAAPSVASATATRSRDRERMLHLPWSSGAAGMRAPARPCNGWRRNSLTGVAFRLSFAYAAPREAAMVTKRQKQLMDYLQSYIAEHQYAPTLDEIGRHFGLASLATVHKHLQNLERKGLIRRLANQSRALQLVDTATAAAAPVPLLGIVAAGAPIEQVETPETVTLPEEMLGRGETFALRVRGDSMIGEGILDGDVIVVEARPDAPNGTVVVALVRGEATVKKLFRERGRVRLQPANERVAPIVAAERDVQIRGIVIAVLRRYR